MSVPSAAEALKFAEQVKLEKALQLKQEIDTDIQTLKERADYLVRNTECDSKGYYTFKVRKSDIKYNDSQEVINQFCMYMEDQGYVVPQIPFQKSFWKGNGYYMVKFRPSQDEDDI